MNPASEPATPPPDDNLDPLTHEPGAHPVGVGVGAAGAGTIGAVIGALVGPLGAIAGAAVGALAGGLLGKEAAENIHPTRHDDLLLAGEGGSPAAAGGAPTEPASAAAVVSPAESRSPARPAASRLRKIVLVPPSVPVVARSSYPEGNVRVAAYYRYLHRREQGAPGDETGDWVEAEKQVLGPG